ncbi:hypothetical protein QTP70_023759 [Hemibagrus guttatus]|uniref:Uncharacterized protein n=1 Tax=Hemibagrus guttatus TaxID=175788 RepID=A0AAE0PYZ5_9TELE|nr:hypothetical protein QTP70_023759 [Hemibagrus guttatus]
MRVYFLQFPTLLPGDRPRLPALSLATCITTPSARIGALPPIRNFQPITPRQGGIWRIRREGVQKEGAGLGNAIEARVTSREVLRIGTTFFLLRDFTSQRIK